MTKKKQTKDQDQDLKKQVSRLKNHNCTTVTTIVYSRHLSHNVHICTVINAFPMRMRYAIALENVSS